jgi:hypothetical protein
LSSTTIRRPKLIAEWRQARKRQRTGALQTLRDCGRFRWRDSVLECACPLALSL